MKKDKKSSKIIQSFILLIAGFVLTLSTMIITSAKVSAAPNCYEKYGANAVLAYECTTSDAFIMDLANKGIVSIDESKCYVKDLSAGAATATEAECNPLRFADTVLPKCFTNKRLTDCGATVEASKSTGAPMQVGKCYDITNTATPAEVACATVAPAKALINGTTTCPEGMAGCSPSSDVPLKCKIDPTADGCSAKMECTKGDLSEANCGITRYLRAFINLLSALVGIVVVMVMVIGGIQYSTSAGDPNAAAAAKKRISNAILALITFAMMYGFLQWIVPGGVL